ncbi:Rrf2 family transcriptional regulator [Paludicola sp. MB14-C6]|uniref:RrF2 family transcriptional regulator n=1 Tax=Paludihabitans sp. MB14-C6 TaxID=3070656 RepID=UPI0027DB9F68|nr:Rrf2 family transcriptional regulator [Paludicola sp. MB14-C6]WMJ23794.1 Rrf2 family transcriptional regulator [Paludicola sp. MB14-C6]
MHITLEADYAVRIVVYLADAKQRADANTISEATGVSLRFALKILRNLVSSGIVKSFKGTQGGYELNQDPKQITLKSVLEAVEGEYRFSRCLNPESPCTRPKEYDCKVQKVFCKITSEVQKMLDEVTIDSLC